MRCADTKERQNSGIQILRGIACVFVVLCHTKATNIGSWGVDIFFVISGFMLVHSTCHNRDKFLTKRIKKIVPLYWFMTIVTSIFICVAPSLFNSYEFEWIYLIKSLFFIPYRHSGIDSPIYGLGWTLNYEMLVYLIFGCSMQISHKYRSLIAGMVCIVLTIAGCTSQMYFLHYYGNGILIEFVAGMVLYYIMRKFTDRVNLYLCEGLMIAVFILFIFAGAISIYLNMVLATIAFISAWKMGEVLREDKQIVKIGVFIGNASYYIYLTHIYVVRIVERILPGLPVLFQAVIAIVCACAAGVLMCNGIVKLRSVWMKIKAA